MLVVPATQKAKAGVSLEPRSSWPAWATYRDPNDSKVILWFFWNNNRKYNFDFSKKEQ
jgi:hypothetical protein